MSEIDADLIFSVGAGKGGLWQGAKPPLGETLRRAGFDVLVLCAEEWQPDKSAYPGVTIVRAPNEDSDRISAAQWKTANGAALVVASMLAHSKKVLVTCQAGLNRSGLVSALTIRAFVGLSGTDSARMVQRARRRALFNVYFCKLLGKLPARGPAAPIERPIASHYFAP